MSEMAIEGVVTGNTPGAQLQAARQGMGWSVEQVAEQLKWAPRQVLALEAGDYKALPGMATVRGFLRAYAKLVKLDPAPLVAQYDQQNGTATDVLPVRRELATPFSEVRLPSMHKRGLSPAGWAIIGALVLLVCVLIASHMGWLKPLPADLFGRKPGPLASQMVASATVANTATTSVAPVSPTPAPAATLATPLPAPAITPTPSPVATAAPVSNGVTATGDPATGTGGMLVLKFRQDCWVEVKRVNGNVLLSRLLKAGETESIPMNDPVQLVVGNVAGVEATLRGQPLVLKNAAGNTARVMLK